MDLGAKVFPVSGGLPLPQRAPQRQAYRLVELDRFRRFLGLPMNVKPRFFPVAADPAARLIVATDREQGSAAALELTGRILTACWAEERDIASAETLSALLAESGLEASLLAASTTPEVQATYDAHTQAAIEAGVFGAPSYVIDGEIFWGQDRLDFVARRLLQG
jgi:carboxymethylenebutenolidase